MQDRHIKQKKTVVTLILYDCPENNKVRTGMVY